jgi:hypothetical protein
MSLMGIIGGEGGIAPKTQVTFGAAGAGANIGSSGTLTLAYPTGITAGMFLLVCVHSAGTITDPGAPWTLGSFANDGTGHAKTYWKVADGSEAGNFTITCGAAARGRIFRFSNGTGVESLDGIYLGATGTAIACLDVTSTKPLSLACQFMYASCTVSCAIAAATGESGGDYGLAVANYAQSANIQLALQTATLAAAGSITGGTAVCTGGTFIQRSNVSFVINP